MRLLLLSNAKREGMGYLEHASGYLRDFFAGEVREILFIPFAGVTKTYDQFVEQIKPVFGALGIGVTGVHTVADPHAAVRGAQAIVVGGGNTWRLLRELREHELLPVIRNRVLAGVPYVGWSAGANITCPTIMTSNDMPICDPGGFDALALIPFQINPHYLHGNPPGFKGETREERIAEYRPAPSAHLGRGIARGHGFSCREGLHPPARRRAMPRLPAQRNATRTRRRRRLLIPARPGQIGRAEVAALKGGPNPADTWSRGDIGCDCFVAIAWPRSPTCGPPSALRLGAKWPPSCRIRGPGVCRRTLQVGTRYVTGKPQTPEYIERVFLRMDLAGSSPIA